MHETLLYVALLVGGVTLETIEIPVDVVVFRVGRASWIGTTSTTTEEMLESLFPLTHSIGKEY